MSSCYHDFFVSVDVGKAGCDGQVVDVVGRQFADAHSLRIDDELEARVGHVEDADAECSCIDGVAHHLVASNYLAALD